MADAKAERALDEAALDAPVDDHDVPAPLIDPVVLGVPLSAYAAVIAHRGEGILLAESLEHQAIEPAIWFDVDRAWSALIARDAMGAGGADGEGVLLSSFDRHRAAADGDVERPLPPLDEDLRSWLDLFRIFCSSDRPLELLAEHGLSEADVFRLLRLWDARVADDQERVEEMGRILAEPPGPVPRVSPGPPRLRPETRRTPAAATAETDALGDEDVADLVPTERPPPPEAGAATGSALTLHEYASLRAELTRAPTRTDDVLARWRLTRATADSLHQAWWERFAASPSERDEFDAEYQGALEALQRAAQAPPATARPAQPPHPPPRPRPRLGDTITAVGAPPGSVLPFGAKKRPPPVDDPLTATLPPMIEHATLPFVPAPAPLEATRAPEISDAPALPFAPRSTRGTKLPLRGYALLCAEIAVAPQSALAIIGRYGLSVDDKRAEDAAWQARFDADEKTHQQWTKLVRGATEMLQKKR